jgi:cytochrome c
MKLESLACLAVLLLCAGAAQAASPAEVALGATIFDRHCSLCHDNSKHMINDSGPALFGVVGRPVASVEGYDYSPILRDAGKRGERWTQKQLDRFLTNPEVMHPGTGMPMNFEKPADRKAIIAYLKTLR